MMKTKREKIKQKIAKANKHHESFIRGESWRYVRLHTSWRRPQGNDTKMRWVYRRGSKGGLPSSPTVGFRTDCEIRGMHPSGYECVVIHSEHELNALKPKRHAIMIGASVGRKKRITLKDVILGRGFKLLNPGIKIEEAPEAAEISPDVDATVGKVETEDATKTGKKVDLSDEDLKDVEKDVKDGDKK
nr:eL32 family ribosomal protein [Candidatus Sigynarchaeota archaeon]